MGSRGPKSGLCIKECKKKAHTGARIRVFRKKWRLKTIGITLKCAVRARRETSNFAQQKNDGVTKKAGKNF